MAFIRVFALLLICGPLTAQVNQARLGKALRESDFEVALEEISETDITSRKLIEWYRNIVLDNAIFDVPSPKEILKEPVDTTTVLSRFLFHLYQGDYLFLSKTDQNLKSRDSYLRALNLSRGLRNDFLISISLRRILDLNRFKYLDDNTTSRSYLDEYGKIVFDDFEKAFLYYYELILGFQYYKEVNWDLEKAETMESFANENDYAELNTRVFQLLSSYEYRMANYSKARDYTLMAMDEVAGVKSHLRSVLEYITWLDLGIYHIELTQLARDKGNYTKADSLKLLVQGYISSLDTFNHNKLENDYVRFTHYYRAKIDTLEGNYESAFDHLSEYLLGTERDLEKSREQTLKELETRFRANEKEKELEVSKRRLLLVACFTLLLLILSIALAITFRKIKSKNHRIEVLMRELNHRVKNNLQVISSLLGLQSMKLKDAEAQKAVSEGKGRIRAMSLIHQKLYQDEEFASLDIGEYLKNLVNELTVAYGFQNDVDLQLSLPSVILEADTALPIGLIINELVTNTYKYAFLQQDQPELKITLYKEPNGNLILNVSDNGPGLPADFIFESASSFGLKLVNLLTRQLGGRIDYTNSNGAFYQLSFKPHP